MIKNSTQANTIPIVKYVDLPDSAGVLLISHPKAIDPTVQAQVLYGLRSGITIDEIAWDYPEYTMAVHKHSIHYVHKERIPANIRPALVELLAEKILDLASVQNNAETNTIGPRTPSHTGIPANPVIPTIQEQLQDVLDRTNKAVQSVLPRWVQKLIRVYTTYQFNVHTPMGEERARLVHIPSIKIGQEEPLPDVYPDRYREDVNKGIQPATVTPTTTYIQPSITTPIQPTTLGEDQNG